MTDRCWDGRLEGGVYKLWIHSSAPKGCHERVCAGRRQCGLNGLKHRIVTWKTQLSSHSIKEQFHFAQFLNVDGPFNYYLLFTEHQQCAWRLNTQRWKDIACCHRDCSLTLTQPIYLTCAKRAYTEVNWNDECGNEVSTMMMLIAFYKYWSYC